MNLSSWPRSETLRQLNFASQPRQIALRNLNFASQPRRIVLRQLKFASRPPQIALRKLKFAFRPRQIGLFKMKQTIRRGYLPFEKLNKGSRPDWNGRLNLHRPILCRPPACFTCASTSGSHFMARCKLQQASGRLGNRRLKMN